MKSLMRSIFLFVSLVVISITGRADVTLPAIISDGMVLQQGMSVPLWGTAEEGEVVTVQFQEQKHSATAIAGLWMVRLDPLKPGGPYSLTISGKNKIELKDVLVGEVWVCSGQSNMGWTVNRSNNAEMEIANAKYPMIRLFTVPRLEADAPVKNIKARWKECSPETVDSFSAVGYFFGRDLYKARNVPIGLIHSSVGGTPAESWTSEATLKSDPEFKSILDTFAPRWDQYQKARAKYNEESAKAKAEGKPAPRAPGRPWKPTALYNGMIAPLIPYAIRGAIWYQGESNANRAYQYRTLFPALIRNWRADWGEGDFPFLFVQLAAFGPPAQKPEESDWAELREAQLLTLSTTPSTGMAVTTDVGAADIHPPNKQPVGARLALAARAIAYHEPIVYSGPIYQSMKVDGNKIVLSFKHSGSGLVANDGALKGFTIAGADKVWHDAQAEIEGDRVVVTSPDVSQPVAARYAWARYPVCNLFNKEGLPASPFRTDQWPGVTQPKPKQDGVEH